MLEYFSGIIVHDIFEVRDFKHYLGGKCLYYDIMWGVLLLRV